jgi:hypothetical protein
MSGQFVEIVECVEDGVGAVLSAHSLVLEFEDLTEATDFLGKYLETRFHDSPHGRDAAGNWWGQDGKDGTRYRYIVRGRPH